MKTQIKTQKLVLGGFLALLVISSFVYMPIYADSHDDDEDDDGVDDSYEDENEREVEIEVQDYEVKIKSSLETGDDLENEFEVSVHAESDGLKFKLEFEEGNETLETEIEFEVEMKDIIEYIDPIDADGMYNSSVDDTVQVYQLGDWNPIEYTVSTVNNETVHSLFIETTDEVFSAALYISGEFADINGVVITPTQIKVDVGIHNFNYTEDDSDLALKVKLESEKEVDYEEDDETEDEIEGRSDDEAEIDVSIGEYAAFFSWIETAMIDGVEQVVKATPLETKAGETKLYLNYPRGTEIIHDPKMGMANLLPSTAGLGSISMVFIAAVALLTIPGLVLLFRKRNRR